MKSPKEMLEQAQRVRATRQYIYADDYADAIELLYEKKNKTFGDIVKFLSSQGVNLSYHTVRRAYKNRVKAKAEARELLRQARAIV